MSKKIDIFLVKAEAVGLALGEEHKIRTNLGLIFQAPVLG